MTVTDIEQAIVAEGKRLEELARKGALEIRKLNLVEELKQIEADLAKFVEVVVEKVSPAKKATPAAKKAAEAKPDETQAADQDGKDAPAEGR